MNAQEAAKLVNSGMEKLSLSQLAEVYAVLKSDENSAGLFRLVSGFARGQLSAYARSSADFQSKMTLEDAAALRELVEEVGFDEKDNLTENGKKALEISAVSGTGLSALKKEMYEKLSKLPPLMPTEHEEFSYEKPDKLEYEIVKEGDTFTITGTLVEVLKRNVVLNDMHSLAYMHKVLRDRGIIKQLRDMGATDTSTVIIGGEEFEFKYTK